MSKVNVHSCVKVISVGELFFIIRIPVSGIIIQNIRTYRVLSYVEFAEYFISRIY